jgi:YVTN family beta-propeller protein
VATRVVLMRLLLGLVGLLSAGASAAAQTVGCVPNTANYPCVYVSNLSDGTVSAINAVTNNVIATIPVNTFPEGLALTPNNSFVYVANDNSTDVSVIETATNTVVATVPLVGFGIQIAITPNGASAYVTEFEQDFEPRASGPARLSRPARRSKAVPQTGPFIEEIDTATNQVVGSIANLNSPSAIAISPNGASAYVADTCSSSNACVEVVSTSNNQISATVQIPGTVPFQDGSIAITPDGSVVCVSVEITVNTVNFLGVAFISTSNNTLLGILNTFGDSFTTAYGFAMTPGGLLYAAGFDPDNVYLVDPASEVLVGTIPSGAGPAGVALAPNGASVYVTDAGDDSNGDTVSVINTKTNAVTATITVGRVPEGVAGMQVFPIPLINQPLVPDTIPAAGSEFTLKVNGTGFVRGSIVNWNGTALATTFVNGGQLTANVPAANIATTTTASVSVTNPAPGGGTSNKVFFPVTSPTASIALAKTDYGTGSLPIAVATGDFNQDGKLDLAVANLNDSTVSVLLGNGDGTFQSQSVYATGSGPTWIATGDFNQDGKLDLAVANLNDSTVSILLGNGDGTFQSQSVYATGSGPDSIATADLNGDGKLDLVVANANDTTVSVLLGNGDGTFQPQSTLSTGRSPVSVVAGDFNGDGILDLAVTNLDGVLILLGNGDGSFQGQSTFPAGESPHSVITADFNGDGRLDLAVTNAVSSAGTVSILLGNGDGTFQSPVAYTAGADTLGVSAGDFNGDGKLDLAVTNDSASTISVLLGNGDGSFQSQLVFSATSGADGIATGDFNGDGRLDLAVTDSSSTKSHSVSVLLQSPTAALDTAALNFGNQAVLTTSLSQQVTITNTGSAPLDVSGITLGGADPGDFGQTNNCTTVPPTESCTIQVDFTPTVVGARTATLSIADNAPGSPQTVSLSGAGVNTLVVTTTTLPGATVGSPYSKTLQATGGTPSYSWTLATGSLPPGLGLSLSGVISGTPTTAGTYTFTVKVTDSNGATATSGTLSIVAAPTVKITTTTLPGATLDVAYSRTLTATGGTPPLTWTISAGSLPPGVILSTGGVISGTPTAGGTFTFTVKATDANGSNAAQPLSIVVAALITISTTTLPNGTVGLAYSQPLQATGGTPPYVWTVSSGSLPAGLSLSSTGVISGTPTNAAASSFTVTVTDANQNSTAEPLGITIVATQTPTITTQPASQTVNPLQTATLSVVATGAPSPTYQWYEGQAGDTSILIAGATNSSYTTPPLTTPTSYWVQVSNGSGSAANSATATVSINLVCTLTVQGQGSSGSSGPLSITATAVCTDLPGQSFTTSVAWGDGTAPATGTATGSGTLTASHTYATLGTYVIAATATATSGIATTTSSPVILIQVPQVPPVFPGQTSDLQLLLATPTGAGNLDVVFECTTVTDSSGTVAQASDLGISCASIPSPVLLTSTPQQVTITIATSGPAAGSIASALGRGNWLPAVWLPLGAVVLFGAGRRKPRLHRGNVAPCLAGGVLVMLLLLFTSCGGGFTAPAVTTKPTPAGQYQLTVVSQPATGQSTTGFVQTSLIVPLSVSPSP